MMQELLVALAEAIAVVSPRGRWNGRVAVARVRCKGRRPVLGHVPARGVEAVVYALIVDLHTWRRQTVRGGLRMRTAGQQRSQ